MPCIQTLLCPFYELCIFHFHAKALKLGSGVFQTHLLDTHFWVPWAFCSWSCPILLLQQISTNSGNKGSSRLPSICLCRMALSQFFNELCGLLMSFLPWQGFSAKLPGHILCIFQRTVWIKPGLLAVLTSFLVLTYFSSEDLVRLAMHSHMV